MARNAAHPQAPHLYIHLMENGPDPEARRGRRRSPRRRPVARRRPPGPHAGAHLLPAWPVEGFDPRQRRRRAPGRSLYPRLQRPRVRPLRLLSAQRPFHRHLGADGGRPADRDPRVAAAGDNRRCRNRDPDRMDPGDPRRALFRGAAICVVRPRCWRCPRPIRAWPMSRAMRHYARAVAYAQQRNQRGFDRRRWPSSSGIAPLATGSSR